MWKTGFNEVTSCGSCWLAEVNRCQVRKDVPPPGDVLLSGNRSGNRGAITRSKEGSYALRIGKPRRGRKWRNAELRKILFRQDLLKFCPPGGISPELRTDYQQEGCLRQDCSLVRPFKC